MNLYRITAGDNYRTFYGNPPHTIERNGLINFAQKPDCSAFLVLSELDWDSNLGIELLDSVPEGYDFTYNQSWGLEVNQTVLDRVIEDLG